jgi:serine/threonine-protein phosphatase 2A regulatory subunit A
LRTNTESLKKIQAVASALGQQRTRDELIPFVTDPQEDDDEILLVLAEQLGELLPFVGGSSHASHLLAPLESLAASDENAVRAATVVAMQKIIKGMTAADIESIFLPLLTRLATGCYPTRVAACALYPDVHPVASTLEQQRLRAEFEALTNDEHPVVRRAAAANLARFAKAAGTEHVNVFLKLFVKISQDGVPLSPSFVPLVRIDFH